MASEDLSSIRDRWLCLIDFPPGAPSLIERLRCVGTWGEAKQSIAPCDRPTMEVLLGAKPSSDSGASGADS